MLSRCRRSVCTACVLLVVVIVGVVSAAQVDDGTPSVTDRGLVSPSVSFGDVLTEHNQHGTDVDTKRFPGETLAYVTPWNGRTCACEPQPSVPPWLTQCGSGDAARSHRRLRHG